MSRVQLSVLLFVSVVFTADKAVCDSSEWVQEKAPGPQVKIGAASGMDKRLPPVLPGQEVKVGDKNMKVWSTSGPVPVSNAAEPWSTPTSYGQPLIGSGVPGLGVIVDQRPLRNAPPAQGSR